MKIGLLGGSFDPVHNGHVRLGRAALRQLSLSRVYFVLSPLSPFKSDRRPTPVEDRMALLKAALRTESKLWPADWELGRRGASYTIDTVRRYRRRRPTDEIYLVMGSDVYNEFDRWKDSALLARLVTLVVGKRPGAVRLRSPRFDRERPVLLKGRFPTVASSGLRQAIRRGRLSRTAVPAAVRAEIKTRGLYGFGVV